MLFEGYAHDEDKQHDDSEIYLQARIFSRAIPPAATVSVCARCANIIKPDCTEFPYIKGI